MQAIESRSLVRQLLTHEAGDSQNEKSLLDAAEHVSEKLRKHMSLRIGEEGFRTLLVRSLTLTSAEFPVLSAVEVNAAGSLIGLRRITASELQDDWDTQTLTDTVDGTIALVAHFLSLLVTFIGEEITLRMFSTLWPEIAWGESAGSENSGL